MIVGDGADAAPDARTPLASFLVAKGGVQDFGGELAAIGAKDVLRGRLVRKNGQPLDMAREAAAEAGYFDHLFGTPDEATARSTVADLLDVLDGELRGTGVGGRNMEAAFAGVEAIVHDVARLAGPAVPDDVLERAARMVIDDGADAGDALERILVRAELDGPLPPRSDDEAGGALPGWSDEELMAAGTNRAGTPAPDGLDDPGAPSSATDEFAAELAAADPDLLLPAEGNTTISVGDVIAGIRHRDGLAALVQACRV